MKSTIIIFFLLAFSVSFCMSQNVKREIEVEEQNVKENKRVQAEQEMIDQANVRKAAAKLEREKEQQYLANEQSYQSAIRSAEWNYSRRHYAQAKENYLTALNLKPANAEYIYSKIAELESPALLKIYRKEASQNALSENYYVHLDNVAVANAKNSLKATITVNDFRRKTISVTIGRKHVQKQIDFEPGKTYYVRTDVISRVTNTRSVLRTITGQARINERTPIPKIDYTPTLELMGTQLGEREFNSIKSKEYPSTNWKTVF